MRVLLIAVLILSGCVTPEEQARIAFENFSPFCDKAGYIKGTPEHGQCVLSLIENDKIRRSNASAAIMGMSQGLMRQSQPIQNAPTRTQCYGQGATLNCVSY